MGIPSGLRSALRVTPRRLGVAALAAGVAVPVALVALDRLVAGVYERLRPGLETQLSGSLGHPLQLGDYRGLRPWGLAIGRTRVLAGPRDASTLTLSGVRVAVAPLASLRRGHPVATLIPGAGRLVLRRNADGAYWVFPPQPAREPPRLDLRLRTATPLSIRVDPAGLETSLALRAEASLHDQEARGRARLTLPRGGRVSVAGDGSWGRSEVDLTLAVPGLELQPLQGLAPEAFPLQLAGRVAGDLRLGWRDGRARCSGGLTLRDLSVAGGPLGEPLSTERWSVRCRDARLTLAPATWRFGDWRAALSGEVALNRSFDLAFAASNAAAAQEVQARLRGPWRRPRLLAEALWQPPEDVPLQGPVRLRAALLADWQRQLTLGLESASIRAPGLALDADGPLHPVADVRTSRLSLAPALWRSLPPLGDLLGDAAALQGSLQLRGTPAEPALTLTLAQAANPLLQQWSLLADWNGSRVRLSRFRSPELDVRATMPLALADGGLRTGPVTAGLRLQDYPLQRIGGLLGTGMDGRLSASGSLHGAWNALEPELALRLEDPAAGPVRLLEVWEGRFLGQAGGGGSLRLRPAQASLPGLLNARLNRSWLPTSVRLERLEGWLSLEGSPASYAWEAADLPLQGLQVSGGPAIGFLPIQGRLSGTGLLGLQPLAMEGRVTVDRPGSLGVTLREIALEGSLREGLVQGEGTITPPDKGTIAVSGQVRPGGALALDAEARDLSARWLTELATALPSLRRGRAVPTGEAADLGDLVIGALDGSIDDQLRTLAEAREQLRAWREARSAPRPFDPDDLRGVVDADLALAGPDPSRLELEARAGGHLWVQGQDVDEALALDPFEARWDGPLSLGEGTFSLAHLPFSLLALLAPVPPALSGAVGLSGRYVLGGERPLLATRLQFEDARLGDRSLALEKGEVTLAPGGLELDLALRAEDAEEPVVLVGQVPLRPDEEGLELRLDGRGDALVFLTALAGDQVAWQGGSADLRLIVQGRLREPQANGFLRVRQGEMELAGQSVRAIESTVLFDFDAMEVQSFAARLGPEGVIEAEGAIGLFAPVDRPDPLVVTSRKAEVELPIVKLEADADLTVTGALPAMRLQGELTLARGTITPARAALASRGGDADGGSGGSDGSDGSDLRPVATNRFREEEWDFSEPLVLLGPEVESRQGLRIRDRVPQLPFLGFDDLRVRIGPDVRVVVAPVADFRTEGLLTLNGRLDSSLVAQGLVRLTRGRISLFTTTFNLDARAPNVAVFTRGLGLIPYVDVVLTSRVSDSLNVGNGLSSEIFERNGTGSFGWAGQLRLVKVVLEAAGPADRLAETISLRSSPPLPQNQLLALIGGNSLAGLSGGTAGAALAAVLGQSLLSPVLGTASEVFNQRLQLAIYPTYVTPFVADQEESNSRRVPPQLVLGTEVGLDVTDRFNFSVLTAPNRNDIPPQATATYQLTPNLSLEGSVDSQGGWQSQMQVFLRF